MGFDHAALTFKALLVVHEATEQTAKGTVIGGNCCRFQFSRAAKCQPLLCRLCYRDAVAIVSVDALASQLAGAIKGGGFFSILQGVASVLSSLSGAGAFGGSGGGGIGGAIAGIAKVFGSLFGGGRANGGPVKSGMSYLVGERGPEILSMGGQPGFITPNNKMNSGGGRGQMVTIVPTPYFDAVVDGRASRQVAMGAPGIASSAASGVQTNLRQSQARSLP